MTTRENTFLFFSFHFPSLFLFTRVNCGAAILCLLRLLCVSRWFKRRRHGLKQAVRLSPDLVLRGRIRIVCGCSGKRKHTKRAKRSPDELQRSKVKAYRTNNCCFRQDIKEGFLQNLATGIKEFFFFSRWIPLVSETRLTCRTAST